MSIIDFAQAKQERGRMIAQVQRDCLHWVCDCSNDLFYVTQEGYYCPNCGVTPEGF